MSARAAVGFALLLLGAACAGALGPSGSSTSAGASGAAGSACGSGAECSSELCFGGRCCAARCPFADLACRALACDAAGRCAYVDAGSACGSPTCVGAALQTSSCDGRGSCVADAALPCAGGEVCSQGVCPTSCLGPGDCDSARSVCDPRSHQCVPLGDTLGPGGAACDAGGQCASGSCLGEVCCSGGCGALTANGCAAQACDALGACVSPACPGLTCGAGGTCPGCTSDAQCLAADLVCVGNGCCPPVAPGSTIYVDGTVGDDGRCCGAAAAPCQTLTQAMAVAVGSRAGGCVLQVTNRAGPEWTAPERWPIQLGFGVTVIAPGLYFEAPATSPALAAIAVAPIDAGDVAAVTLMGDPDAGGAFVHVGFSARPRRGLSESALALQDGALGSGPPGLPLVLSHVWLGKARTFSAESVPTSLFVGPSASVTFGPLPVVIGANDGGRPDLAAAQGILCLGGPQQPAALRDQGAGPLQVEGGIYPALRAGPGCAVSLTQGPQLANGDPAVVDLASGLPATLGSLAQPASVVGDSASAGLRVRDTPLTFVGAVTGCGAAGIATDSTLTAEGSRFARNQIGVYLGVVPLPDGGTDGLAGSSADLRGSQFLCNLQADVENLGAALADLRGARWERWDPVAQQPQRWTCAEDGGLAACVCTGPACDGGGGPLPQGGECNAVCLGSNPAPFLFADGGLAPAGACGG